MLTINEFRKTCKWVFIITAFTFLQITNSDRPPSFESHKKDFYLIRWFSKYVENLSLPALEEGRLIEDYGKESTGIFISSKKLIPTLAAVNVLDHFPNARRYHLAILKKATTMKTAGPGIAILQLKYLCTLYAVNFTNCALYTNKYSLPPVHYCKEMALALLDFSLMATDVLCDKIAEQLFEIEYYKIIFQNYLDALKEFEKTYRWILRKTESTTKDSKNAADRLREHIQKPSNKNQNLLKYGGNGEVNFKVKEGMLQERWHDARATARKKIETSFNCTIHRLGLRKLTI